MLKNHFPYNNFYFISTYVRTVNKFLRVYQFKIAFCVRVKTCKKKKSYKNEIKK